MTDKFEVGEEVLPRFALKLPPLSSSARAHILEALRFTIKETLTMGKPWVERSCDPKAKVGETGYIASKGLDDYGRILFTGRQLVRRSELGL